MQKPWHTAKVPIFAVCKNQGTRQRFELCRVPRLQGTRQIFGHVIVPGWLLYFAVGREWHTANPFPCTRYIAHGKCRLCRCLVAVCGTRQRVCRVQLWTHGKKKLPPRNDDVARTLPCALLVWHTAKFKSLPCAMVFAHDKDWHLCRVPWFLHKAKVPASFFFCLIIMYMVPPENHIYHNDYSMYPNKHHRYLIHTYK